MYINPDMPVPIVPLMPLGTNSTLFTLCCYVAICTDERCCPKCGREVVGASEKDLGVRERIRWANATRNWKRK